MAVESPGPISALNPSWPLDSDFVTEGAAHLRVIKETLQTQFAALNAATPRTPAELNALAGASSAQTIQQQLDTLTAQVASLSASISAIKGWVIGDIRWTAVANPGSVPGWILCDGSSVPIGTYPDLFAAIGYTYGGGGGAYNIPNLRARVAVNTGTGFPMGASGGASTVTLTAAQSGLPSHSHLFTAGISDRVLNGQGGDAGVFNAQVGTTQNAGGQGASQAHENMPPYLVINAYILAF